MYEASGELGNPGLTLTYFMARETLVPWAFELKKLKSEFSVAIVLFDMKMHSNSAPKKY